VKDQDIDNANFEAFGGISLSGTVTDKNGQAMSGITVTISGLNQEPETTQTDGTGFYEFTGLGFNTYTVTPFYAGYSFTPSFQEVNIAATDADKNKRNINFVATLGYQIMGKVTDLSGVGLPGITITLRGGLQNDALQTQTDNNGIYSFIELENGSYTITPLFGDYSFNPPDLTITIADEGVFNADFTAAIGASISGYVLEGTTPLKGVTVDLIRTNNNAAEEVIQSVQTNDSGFYILIGVADGSYSVRPRYQGYGFNPSTALVVIRNADITEVNFRATQGLYISGTVTNFMYMPLKDVTLELTDSAGGSAGTTTTDASGYYSFLGLQPDIYTVTNSTPGYLSIPASRVVDIAAAGTDRVNFKMYPTCPVVLLNIPFNGGEGTIVNIFGFNFGFTEPPANLVVDFDGTSVPAGVYFGTADVSTWAKAEVLFWSPVKILVSAPATTGVGIARVWVINDKGCIYVNPPLTNFFIYTF
jgi:hypothetical protein